MAVAIVCELFARHATVPLDEAAHRISRAWLRARVQVAEGVWEVPVEPDGFWLDEAGEAPATAVVATVVESRQLALAAQNELPPFVGNMEVTNFQLA